MELLKNKRVCLVALYLPGLPENNSSQLNLYGSCALNVKTSMYMLYSPCFNWYYHSLHWFLSFFDLIMTSFSPSHIRIFREPLCTSPAGADDNIRKTTSFPFPSPSLLRLFNLGFFNCLGTWNMIWSQYCSCIEGSICSCLNYQWSQVYRKVTYRFELFETSNLFKFYENLRFITPRYGQYHSVLSSGKKWNLSLKQWRSFFLKQQESTYAILS